MPMLRRRGFLLLAPLLAAACARASGAPEPAPALEMEEVFSVTLPATFALAGAALASDGRAAAWASDAPHLMLVAPDGSTRTIAANLVRPLAAAFVAGDSVLEVVDRDPARIVRLGIDGRIHSEATLRVEVFAEPESAARGTDAWFLGGRTAGGDYVVVRWTPGEARTVHQIAQQGEESSPLTGHLTIAGEGVLLTLLRAPFEVARIPGHPGERTTTFRPEIRPDEAGATAAAGGDGWVSLATLPLDDGFLQTLADLRSDRRIIVVYDKDGRTRRHTLVDVPIGMVATEPARRLLLAARRTDGLELVGYRWHWSDTPTPEEEQR